MSGFIKTFFTVILLLVGGYFASAQRLPNILLLTVDDMNYNSSGMMGGK